MNRKTILLAGCSAVAMLVLLPAMAKPLLGQERGSVAKGAREYGNLCGSCHNARSPKS